MKLKEFRVERCGSLYFLTLNNKVKSLKEYLGEYYKEIEEMTNGFGKQIDVNRMKIKSNWKVIIENTMEAYHLGLVHTDTLAKLMPTTSIDNLKFSFCGPHSNYIIPLLSINGIKFNNGNIYIDMYLHQLMILNHVT